MRKKNIKLFLHKYHHLNLNKLSCDRISFLNDYPSYKDAKDEDIISFYEMQNKSSLFTTEYLEGGTLSANLFKAWKEVEDAKPKDNPTFFDSRARCYTDSLDYYSIPRTWVGVFKTANDNLLVEKMLLTGNLTVSKLLSLSLLQVDALATLCRLSSSDDIEKRGDLLTHDSSVKFEKKFFLLHLIRNQHSLSEEWIDLYLRLDLENFKVLTYKKRENDDSTLPQFSQQTEFSVPEILILAAKYEPFVVFRAIFMLSTIIDIARPDVLDASMFFSQDAFVAFLDDFSNEEKMALWRAKLADRRGFSTFLMGTTKHTLENSSVKRAYNHELWDANTLGVIKSFLTR